MTTRQTLQEILNDYQYHLRTGSKAKAIRILKAQVVDLVEFERHFYYQLGQEAGRYEMEQEAYLKQLPVMKKPSQEENITSAKENKEFI